MTQHGIINDEALDIIFRKARTYAHWKKGEISDSVLRSLYDLVKYGPTSANCSPARLVFIQSPEAKVRLKPFLSEGNIEKTMNAPVTAIIAYDMEFYEHLPKLFPHTDAKSWYEGKPDFIEKAALVNGTLQAAYFIIAARSLGLDCGPMTGFNNKALDQEFFKESSYRSNILCNLGYGDPEKLYERLPRFTFDEVCKIL